MTRMPPHEVRTERLVLRSARPGDGAALQHTLAVSRSDFYPWLGFAAHDPDEQALERVSREAQEKFRAGEFFVWRVWEPQGPLIGTVDLHSLNPEVPSCEIGFWLSSERLGRGYATEFVRAALELAWRDLEVVRIEARCDERNERAQRLVERLGFSYEGTARNDDRDAAGELCSTRVYALTRGDESREGARGPT